MTQPVQTQTITLTSGQTQQLPPPAASPANTVAGVILQNNSPYQVTVNYNGNTYPLAPYASDVYRLGSSGGQLALTVTDPTSSAASALPAYLTATWLSADLLPDPAAYPSTLTPPPIATGIAIAEELLAGGIPSVLVETAIFNGTIAAGATQTYDVSAFASLSLYLEGVTDAADLRYQFISTSGKVIDTDRIRTSGATELAARLAVSAGTFKITNMTAGGNATVITISLIGSNRAAAARLDVRDTTGIASTYNVASSAWSANTDITVGALSGVQGLCFLEVRVSAAAGTFRVALLDVINNAQVIIADSGEMVASSSGGRYVSKLIAVPPSDYFLLIHTISAFTASFAAGIVQAGL